MNDKDGATEFKVMCLGNFTLLILFSIYGCYHTHLEKHEHTKTRPWSMNHSTHTVGSVFMHCH